MLLRLCLLGAAFVAVAAFSSDTAGRACVRAKGERGVAYDIGRTKVGDAYSPNGRRLIEDGHRLYQIEVPPLVKRDKGIFCTMRLDSGLWREPAPNPFAERPDPLNPRGTPERSFR